jgi:FkbM family methyltransferase
VDEARVLRSGSWRTAKPIDLLAYAVDRASGARGLRRLRSARAVNRFADAVYHAQLVEESFRFGARELFDPRAASTYRPRDRPLVARIRHHTGDLYVLNEIVRHRGYDFPAEPVCRLEALGRPPRVVDAGANIGLFGIEVLNRFPQATITAFEPDPANAAVHEETIRSNGLERSWTLIRSCAGTAAGSIDFAAQGGVGSHVESSADSISVPVVDLFPYLQQADLVKMDIEGSEWPILADARLQALDELVIVLEYHRHGCPHADAREAALRLLGGAGFTAHDVDAPHQPDGTGVVWAWK